MNKTREDAEKIIKEEIGKAKKAYVQCNTAWSDDFDNVGDSILDALYPKPESERLKRLKEMKEKTLFALRETSVLSDVGDAEVMSLFDEAIEREKAKPCEK